MTHGANIVSEAKRQRALKHLRRTYTCVCGRACRGNGGWSSHKRACRKWIEARTPDLFAELGAIT